MSAGRAPSWLVLPWHLPYNRVLYKFIILLREWDKAGFTSASVLKRTSQII